MSVTYYPYVLVKYVCGFKTVYLGGNCVTGCVGYIRWYAMNLYVFEVNTI